MGDAAKVQKIKNLIKKNPSGLWVREIARKARLSRSTVSRYVYGELRGEVKIEWHGRNKIIKLK